VVCENPDNFHQSIALSRRTSRLAMSNVSILAVECVCWPRTSECSIAVWKYLFAAAIKMCRIAARSPSLSIEISREPRLRYVITSMPNRRTPEQPERNRIGPMGGRFFLMCADIDMLFFPGVNLLMPKARLERSSLAAHRDLSNDARRLNAGASKNAPRTVRALPARVVYPTTPVSGSGIDVDKVPASVNVVDVIQISASGRQISRMLCRQPCEARCDLRRQDF
jgi:hypothetical protein